MPSRASLTSANTIPSAEYSFDRGVIELFVVYRNTVLKAVHIGQQPKVRPNSDPTCESFVVGEAHHVDFHLPASLLQRRSEFSLISESAPGEFHLNFFASTHGELVFEGQCYALQELVNSGKARPFTNHFSLSICPGSSGFIEIGEVCFRFRWVPQNELLIGRDRMDKVFWAHIGGTACVAACVWMALLSWPADSASFELDDDVSNNRFARYIYQADQIIDEETPPAADSNTNEESVGEAGQRHAGAEGKAGKPTSKHQNKAYALKGNKSAAKQLARNFDPDMSARSAGILGVIAQSQGSFMHSPYAQAFANGHDDENLWGNLIGSEVGEAYGVGGIGLAGSGRGGGGIGEGTVGLGNVGTIGHSGVGKEGIGYGRGSGAGIGGRGKRVPRTRQGVLKTKGALDQDVIRRIVRNHINEVRSCYNQGLVRNPNLQGKVSINFMITGTGRVASSTVQESSVKDRSVGNCVAKAVKRWKFPKPRGGGNAIVTYPFRFSSGG